MFMMKAIGLPYFSMTLSRGVPNASRVTSGGEACWPIFVSRLVLSFVLLIGPPPRAADWGISGDEAAGDKGAKRIAPGCMPTPLSMTKVPAGTKIAPPGGKRGIALFPSRFEISEADVDS